MLVVQEGGGPGIGVMYGKHDGWDGQGPHQFFSDAPELYLGLYREHSDNWGGLTGFYDEDYESPIPAGGSKTWWDFYLWPLNMPSPPSQVHLINGFDADMFGNDGPPAGYIGHLVIDQVAAGATWAGPMDYWFDMSVRNNTFILPIANVSDPLQGTRFHLTVYAPEPSSFIALLGGVAGLGGFALKRRRR